ncbi:M48 family metallopeptidase [Dysgonomonas sp. 25]|uniref:tetratricopeptide repeat protein n=1 Tax=Dysgonomonas sp. 25 TaxID=2302933 RepID=UPI0013D675EA|nr:hypothetical protein [Dysgonomonas sp. 25]NDV69838.1 hypothetical protein [Dysgonomonas sp. 25]
MKKLILLALLTGILFSSASCQTGQSTEERATNLKPMYGKGKKTKGQLEADREFLRICDSIYSSRQKAAIEHVEMGFYYIGVNDNETAMKRFNQAWLLDSLNTYVYCGFGILMYEKSAYKESMDLLDKAIQLDPANPVAYFRQAINANRLFLDTREESYREQSTKYLQKAIELNPDADYGGQMTAMMYGLSTNADKQGQTY